MLDSNGSNFRRITSKTNGGLRGPDPISWSPDGAKIAFSRNNANASSSNLFIMDVNNTSNITQITNALTGHYYTSPHWSPDGTKLLFSVSNQNIYISDINGSNMTHIASGMNPAWSPDGNTVAYISQASGNNEVHVVKKDGTGHAQITDYNSNSLTEVEWY